MELVKSYYEHGVDRGDVYPPLVSNHKARLAIIGGGYAGLATALGLAERGYRDIVLLEAVRIGYGASGRNGGFVFGGYSRSEEKLVSELPGDRGKRMYARTTAAVDLIRERIGRYEIDCDLLDQGVVWANWFRSSAVLERKARFLREKLGVEWLPLDRQTLKQYVRSERYSGGLLERNAMHLNPLKYALGLARAASTLGVKVHEQSELRKLSGKRGQFVLRTAQGVLNVDEVIMAGGAYQNNVLPVARRAMLPIATYVMTTEPLGDQVHQLIPGDAAVYDTRFAFDYYRKLNDTRLLWGGRISITERNPERIAALLRADLIRVFPSLKNVRIDFAWSGLMSYGRHQMVQITQAQPGLWALQGFGGHGVAATTAMGEVLAAALAINDLSWTEYNRYPLNHAGGPFGLCAAQLSYWGYQIRDALG